MITRGNYDFNSKSHQTSEPFSETWQTDRVIPLSAPNKLTKHLFFRPKKSVHPVKFGYAVKMLSLSLPSEFFSIAKLKLIDRITRLVKTCHLCHFEIHSHSLSLARLLAEITFQSFILILWIRLMVTFTNIFQWTLIKFCFLQFASEMRYRHENSLVSINFHKVYISMLSQLNIEIQIESIATTHTQFIVKYRIIRFAKSIHTSMAQVKARVTWIQWWNLGRRVWFLNHWRQNHQEDLMFFQFPQNFHKTFTRMRNILRFKGFFSRS